MCRRRCRGLRPTKYPHMPEELPDDLDGVVE
jgi:hypothetical protein